VRQKFEQYERDNETGLDYAVARYFVSVQGRFTSVDPLMASAKASMPQSWNRYAFCLNNPPAVVDPTGLIWGILDGNLSWYKDEEALKNAGATAYTNTYYPIGNGYGVYLNPNGPGSTPTEQQHPISNIWKSAEGAVVGEEYYNWGWSQVPTAPINEVVPDMDSQFVAGGIF
jgi:RHS repeat-associated protein